MSELEQYAGCDALIKTSQEHELSIIDIYAAFCEEIDKIKRQENVEQYKKLHRKLSAVKR